MNIILRFLCVLPFLVVAFGCGTTLKYHYSRGELVPTKKIIEDEVCKQLKKMNIGNINCKKDKYEKVKENNIEEFVEYMELHLPKNYFTATGGQSHNHLQPSVDVTSLTPISAPPPPSFFISLTPEGQTAVMEYMSKRLTCCNEEDFKALETLLQTLRYGKAKDDTHPTSFDRNRSLRLVVSTSLNSSNPADRMEKAYTFIYIPTDTKIIDVDELKTEELKIDLGTQHVEAGVDATAGVGATIGAGKDVTSITPSVNITPKYKATLDRTLSKRFATRNRALNHNLDTLFISQEGAEGIDISGNVLTTITLQLENKPTTVTVFSNSAKGWTMETHDFQNVGDVKGVVVWVAQARVVPPSLLDNFWFLDKLGSSGDTIEEGDDRVVPEVFRGVQPITLWQNDEQFYFLTVKAEDKKYILSYKMVDKPRLMAFKKKEDAISFRDIIQENKENKEIMLPKGIKIGFVVDGSENLVTKIENKDLKDVEIKIYMTEPCDFPLPKVYVFDKESCNGKE